MLLDADLRLINEAFYAEVVTAAQLDMLLANAWRHFGMHFFRYNLGVYQNEIRRVTPLRIRLDDFSLSKSQRRVLRKNSDLQTTIEPIVIAEETEALFEVHKQRFKTGIPDSIYDFLSPEPAIAPIPAFAVTVRRDGELLAVSFFDVGETSVSSIYAIFQPAETSRSLGIFTMLKELEFAADSGREFFYQGYCYEGESFYDYKKRFAGNQTYDWRGNWASYERSVPDSN